MILSGCCSRQEFGHPQVACRRRSNVADPGDSFLILDLGLNVVDGVRGLHLEGDGLACEGFNEDLHLYRTKQRYQILNSISTNWVNRSELHSLNLNSISLNQNRTVENLIEDFIPSEKSQFSRQPRKNLAKPRDMTTIINFNSIKEQI